MVTLSAGLMDAMRAAALEAGQNALRVKKEGRKATEFKDDRSLVTLADKEGEAIIRKHLQPFIDQGFGFLGEETGATQGTNGFQFVIDPIDGTTNYEMGDANWMVSIGLTHKGEPVAGVTYQPMTDKLYHAEKGKGAFLTHQGETTQLKIPETPPTAYLLETAFSRHPNFEGQRAFNATYFERIPELTHNRQMGRVRNAGCPSLPLCLLAEGGRTGVVAKPVLLWDVAASVLIAQEAGAKIHLAKENLNDTSPTAAYNLVAATEHFFPELKRIFDATVGRSAHIYRTGPNENIAQQLAKDGITYGVSVGRRQPMHRVHVDCIREMVAAGLHPVIAIGSVNEPDSRFHNPVTNPLNEAQQREQIRIAMEKAGITDYTVICVKDMGDGPYWSAALAKALQDQGIDPAKCVSHSRPKDVDVLQSGKPIKTMKDSERNLYDYGLSVWQSTNSDPSMDPISASPFRAMDLHAPTSQLAMEQDLAAPDYIMQEAMRARNEDPDNALLKDVPLTLADLSLKRFREERHLSTAQILNGQPATSLTTLQEKLAEVTAPPGPTIEGNLLAQSGHNQERVNG